MQSCRQVSRQAIDLTLRLYDPSLTLAILGSSRDKVCRGLTSDLRRGRRRRPLLESGIYPISKRPKSFRFLKNQICPASQKQESSLKKLCQRQIDVIRGTAMPVNQMECRRAKSGAGPGKGAHLFTWRYPWPDTQLPRLGGYRTNLFGPGLRS